MGKIAEQLQQALVSKANIRDELQSKGMDPSTKFESYYTFIRTMSGGSIQYYIWVRTSDETKGHIHGSGMYNLGDIVTIKAEAEPGYTFDHWSSATGRIDSDKPILEVTVESADIIEAHFEEIKPETYQISTSCDPDNGGTVSGAGSYQAGSTATLTATANSGYTFATWSDGVTTNPRSITVTKDAEYTAKFEKVTPKYLIQTVSNPTTGGTINGGGSYLEGTSITIQATPANDNYKFYNWVSSVGASSAIHASTTNPYENFEVKRAETITANWSILTKVASNDKNRGTVQIDKDYVEAGKSAKITATAESGFTFVQWNDGNKSATRSITVNEPKTYTAIFGILITFDTAGGATVNPKSYTGQLPVTAATLQLPTPTRTSGYKFVGWKLSDGTMVTDSTKFESNTTLTAVWEKIVYAKYTTVDTLISDFSDITEDLSNTTQTFGANWIKKQTYVACPENKTPGLSYTSAAGTFECRLSEYSMPNTPTGWKVYRYKSTSSISSISAEIKII